MKAALYAGERSFIGNEILKALNLSDYEVSFSVTPGKEYDLVVDASSSSPVEIRTLIAGIGGRCGHYVFISSCDVYPPTPRARPWQEAEADVCEDLADYLPANTKVIRSLEREVRAAASGRFPFTILRPSLVDGPNDPHHRSLWFVRRIYHGGLIVLPDGDLPVYRHVMASDLAKAVCTVADREEAFGKTMNVVGSGMLNYWGHAAMLRDGLRYQLRYAYVPARLWRAAGLSLPMGEGPSPSFIDASPLLHQLGWRPSNEIEAVMGVAQSLLERAKNAGDAETYQRERRLLEEFEAQNEYTPGVPVRPLQRRTEPQTLLRGRGGRPGSLSMEWQPQLQKFPKPVVRVDALALGPTEENLLKGDYFQHGSFAMGHNALLTILDSAAGGEAADAKHVTFGVMPCGDPECPFCKGGARGVLGVGFDGYGWGVCTTPPSHMVPAPPELGMASLLADPLAALMYALETPLQQGKGPVWVAGRTVEAALAAWLAQDAGREVHMVDRRVWNHDEFPVKAVATLEQQVRQREIPAPELAIDFTGCGDVTWPMALSLADGGHLHGRRRPLGITHGRHMHVLPAACPSRAWLERALQRLLSWQEQRDLTRRVGPGIPRQLYWDALLHYPFSLPYLEDRI